MVTQRFASGWGSRLTGDGASEASRIDLTFTPDGDGTILGIVESGCRRSRSPTEREREAARLDHLTLQSDFEFECRSAARARAIVSRPVSSQAASTSARSDSFTYAVAESVVVFAVRWGRHGDEDVLTPLRSYRGFRVERLEAAKGLLRRHRLVFRPVAFHLLHHPIHLADLISQTSGWGSQTGAGNSQAISGRPLETRPVATTRRPCTEWSSHATRTSAGCCSASRTCSPVTPCFVRNFRSTV